MASSASADSSHLVSPSSISLLRSAALAFSHRSVRSSTVSAASPSTSSANPATTYSRSIVATTGCLPSARHGIWSESFPTSPLRTTNGRSSAFSASVFSRRFFSTTSPLNTATLRSLALMPWTYSPSSLFSTDVSLPSNMADASGGELYSLGPVSSGDAAAAALRDARPPEPVRTCIRRWNEYVEPRRVNPGACEVGRRCDCAPRRPPEPPRRETANNVGDSSRESVRLACKVLGPSWGLSQTSEHAVRDVNSSSSPPPRLRTRESRRAA